MLPDFPDHQAPSQSLKAPLVAACLLHLCLVGCLGWFMSQSSLQRPIPLVSIELSASLIEGSTPSATGNAKAPDTFPQPSQTTDVLQKKQGQQEQTKQAKAFIPQANKASADKTSAEKTLQNKPMPQEPLKKPATLQTTTQATPQATPQAPPQKTALATTQKTTAKETARVSTETIHQRTTPSSTAISDSAPLSDSAPSPSASQTENLGSPNTATPQNSTSASSPNTASKGDPRAEKAYLASIVQKLHRSLRYPESAREKRLSGTTTVQFTINLKGQVSDERVHTPSGHPELDKEALALIKRAAPFRSIPTSLGHETMTLTVPIRFSLK